MNSDRMFELAQALAVAKSRQDVPAALTVLHDDMLLETPAFGTSARGLAENAKVLTRFFTSFPDYNVVLEGYAGDPSPANASEWTEAWPAVILRRDALITSVPAGGTTPAALPR